jgi:hypothetical protein
VLAQILEQAGRRIVLELDQDVLIAVALDVA